MAEPLKALLDRVRRCDCKVNHALNGKKAMIVACAGGSGNGAVRCLGLMEDTLKHMGMDVRERIPVTRFSSSYMPKAIQSAAWHLCYELNETPQ